MHTQRNNDRRTTMYAPAARVPRALLPTRCSWQCSGVVQQKRIYAHRQPSPSTSSWKHGTWITRTSLHGNPAVTIAGHRVPFRQRRFVGDQRFCARLHHGCVHKRGTPASAPNELIPLHAYCWRGVCRLLRNATGSRRLQPLSRKRGAGSLQHLQWVGDWRCRWRSEIMHSRPSRR